MGKLVAPKMLDARTDCESDSDWLQFKDVGNLVVDGSGEIDGQGSSWWTTPNQYDRLSRKLMMNNQNCKAPDVWIIFLFQFNLIKSNFFLYIFFY